MRRFQLCDTRCQALDLAPHGIRSNSISPGWIWTEVLEAFSEGDRPKWEAVWGKYCAMDRCAEPSEVAAAIAFLDSPEVPALLKQQRVEAYRWGVTGIPTWFVLPDGWTPEDGIPDEGPRPVKVVGCQPLSVVTRAAELAGATPRG